MDLDLVTIDQTPDELQAFVATSTTYQEPIPIERSKSSPTESADVFDFQ